MTQRRIVKLSACLEIVVDAIFVAAPNVPCILLFDAKPENIGRALARWVGVSPFALAAWEIGRDLVRLWYVAISLRINSPRSRRLAR